MSHNQTASELYESLFAEMGQSIDQWQRPKPSFTFEIGWAASYEQLFKDEFERRSPVSDVLLNASSFGRVIIAAKGGAAKTTILQELFREVITNRAGLPVFISMRSWRATFYEQWEALPESWIARLNFILQKLCAAQTSTAALDVVSTKAVITLFVDGLNEVSSSVAQDFLVVLDEFVSRTAQSRVIVSDRLVRRMLPTATSWQLATILPLEPSQVRASLLTCLGSDSAWTEALEPDRQILQIPFFLNQRLHSQGAPSSRSATFGQYFADHALGGEQLDVVGRAALQVYQENGSRTFPLSEFRESAGEVSTDRLLHAGTIKHSNGLAYFHHHLHQDYLASRYLAEHHDDWNASTFDRITYGASSFSILSLTLEQLRDIRDIDRFLTVAYAWNLYGAAYALGEAYSSAIPVSPEMETVIVAMLADRMWDLTLATVQRARDALALFPVASLGRRMLSVGSRAELLKYVDGVQGAQPWFAEWKFIFTTADQSRVDNDLVKHVLDSRSIIGWTTANVLRRIALDKEQQELLRSWASAEGQSSVVVWRIAHALGTHASRGNRDLLMRLLSFEFFWVRYGAIRSLVECAARSTSRLRRSTFEQLRRSLEGLPNRLVAEFEESVLIDPKRAPQDWAEVTIPLLRELYNQASSDTDRVRIQHTAHELAKTYLPRLG